MADCCLDTTGMPAGTSKRMTKSDARKSSSVWRLSLPYWISSQVLEICGIQASGGWDFTFRTYTEIPWNAGVDRLVREGKIEILRNLFASGQLSALHRNGNHTLLHVSFQSLKNSVPHMLNEQ